MDENEAKYYYYGVSGARLVVRTSIEPWHFRLSPSGWDQRLTLDHKGYAPLGATRGDADLVPRIRSCLGPIAEELELAKLPWTWFTAICIGYRLARRPKRPVFLINVEPGKVAFTFGYQVAHRVKKILNSRNVYIEVEIREGLVENRAASKELEDAVTWPALDAGDLDEGDQIIQAASAGCSPLLSASGCSIAAKQSSDGECIQNGTMGLFITLDGDEQLYGLSTAHSVLPTRPPRDDVNQGKPLVPIYQGSKSHLDESLTELHFLDSLTRGLHRPEEYIKGLRRQLESLLDSSYDDGESNEISGLPKRLIGRVEWAPECRVTSTEPGFAQDWALLRLDKDKFAYASNSVYFYQGQIKSFLQNPLERVSGLRGLLPQFDYKTWIVAQSIEAAHLSNRGFFRFKPTIPDVAHIGVTRVYKQGATAGTTTGLTYGITNGIEAVVRKSSHSSVGFVWQLIVLPFPSMWGRFSGKGDSGAAVVTMTGEVIGMVVAGEQQPWAQHHGGVAAEGQIRHPVPYEQVEVRDKAFVPQAKAFVPGANIYTEDLTFVTPMDWIFRDIERMTNKKPRVYMSDDFQTEAPLEDDWVVVEMEDVIRGLEEMDVKERQGDEDSEDFYILPSFLRSMFDA